MISTFLYIQRIIFQRIFCYRPVTKVPMNLLGSQTQTASDTQISPLLTNSGASGDATAPSSSFDLDFLIGETSKSKSNEVSSNLGGGENSVSSDFLNGNYIFYLLVYFLIIT